LTELRHPVSALNQSKESTMPANPTEKNKVLEENDAYKKRNQEPQAEELNDEDEDSDAE